jgi:hypothetical protein
MQKAPVESLGVSSYQQAIRWGRGRFDASRSWGRLAPTKNWLPKEGDENVLTKSGIMTKRQAKAKAKVKVFYDFLKDMKYPERTER